MDSFLQVLNLASQYWYIPAALTLLLALVGYAVAYVRALRPRGGTLEWIAQYDRPRFGLKTVAAVFSWREALVLLGIALLSAAAYLTAMGKPYLAVFGSLQAIPREALVSLCLYYGALPALSCVFSFLLLHRLSGSAVAATLGCLVLALDLQLSPLAGLFTAAACLFACRFCARTEQGSFCASCPDLMLTAAILTVGSYFVPALCLLAAVLLVGMITACVVRFVNREKSDGYLPKTVGLFVLTVALVTVCLFVPAALLEGKLFPMLLFSGDYYELIAARVAENFSGLLQLRPAIIAQLAFFDWPLLPAGVLALAAAFAGLIRRRDGRGFLLSLLFLAGVAMWLLCGVYVLPIVCAGSVCYVWSGLLSRGKRVLTAVGAAALIGAELIVYVVLPLFLN